MQHKLFVYNVVYPDIWKNWIGEIATRQDEALETMKIEGVTVEGGFFDESNNQMYFVLSAYDFKKVFASFDISTKAIDIKHKKITKQCLRFQKVINANYFLKR